MIRPYLHEGALVKTISVNTVGRFLLLCALSTSRLAGADLTPSAREEWAGARARLTRILTRELKIAARNPDKAERRLLKTLERVSAVNTELGRAATVGLPTNEIAIYVARGAVEDALVGAAPRSPLEQNNLRRYFHHFLENGSYGRASLVERQLKLRSDRLDACAARGFFVTLGISTAYCLGLHAGLAEWTPYPGQILGGLGALMATQLMWPRWLVFYRVPPPNHLAEGWRECHRALLRAEGRAARPGRGTAQQEFAGELELVLTEER